MVPLFFPLHIWVPTGMRRSCSAGPAQTFTGSVKKKPVVKSTPAAITSSSMATQTEGERSAAAGSTDFQSVLQVITICQTTLTEKMDHVHLEIVDMWMPSEATWWSRSNVFLRQRMSRESTLLTYIL